MGCRGGGSQRKPTTTKNELEGSISAVGGLSRWWQGGTMCMSARKQPRMVNFGGGRVSSLHLMATVRVSVVELVSDITM